jgi:hypothetical protein
LKNNLGEAMVLYFQKVVEPLKEAATAMRETPRPIADDLSTGPCSNGGPGPGFTGVAYSEDKIIVDSAIDTVHGIYIHISVYI